MLRQYVDALNLFTAVVAGFMTAQLAINPDGVTGEFYYFASISPVAILFFLYGWAVVVLNVYAQILDVRAREAHRHLDMQTDEGTNSISLPAIERLLLDEFQKAGDVGEPAIRLHPAAPGTPLQCVVTFKLKQQNDVMARVDTLKHTIRDTFLRLFPSGPGLEIRADVTDLVESTAPRPTAPSSGSGSEFVGPVYPVPGGESNGDD